jgi:hypothetical protein
MILDCFLRSWNTGVWWSAGKSSVRRKLSERLEGAALYGSSKHTDSGVRSEALSIPELEQSQTNQLRVSMHH